MACNVTFVVMNGEWSHSAMLIQCVTFTCWSTFQLNSRLNT